MNIIAYIPCVNNVAVTHNMLSLIEALGSLGHDVTPCYLNNEQNYRNIMTNLFLDKGSKFDFSISFNNWGNQCNIDYKGECKRLYEHISLPHVSILLDEPFNDLCTHEIDVPCSNHLLTYLDRSDGYIFDNYQTLKHPKHKMHLPLGGSTHTNSFSELATSKKIYDVVYSTGLWNNELKSPYWRRENGNTYSYHIKAVLDDVVEIMQQCPLGVKDAFITVLNNRGMYDKEYVQRFYPYFKYVLYYIKTWRKYETLRRMIEVGINVHVLGRGWDNTPFADKFIQHGEVSYDEMLEITKQAKVIVTDAACFNDGVHDRVLTGMLNGAVVISEYSSYVAEIFDIGEDLFLYNWENTSEQMSIAHRLITDENYRLSIVQNAYKKAIKNHTWTARAKTILEAVSILFV